ncbi:hypothetical protein ACFXDJ_03115 [Streptomyces sp. NPDC059443]|uniref:hypothetical protein n=1 Tax=unclassified Streptomyces TaxID=2593676 RepID=UPI0036C4464A
MTAWQYFAGAGLVAALCPLHGHVEVAGDGHGGHGARVDLCVPAGPKPAPPAAEPSARPSARVTLSGAAGPTVLHPGRGPLPAASPRPGAAAQPPPGPTAEAVAGVAEPPGVAVDGPGGAEAAPAEGKAPVRGAAGAGPGGRFHVRPYHSSALARRGPDGMSTVMLMVVVTTPAVLAAVALRPRSKSRS